MPFLTSAIVPAAGASSRFGSMKLLADLGGRPLVERTLGSLLDAGVSQVAMVVAPGHALAAVPLLSDERVTLVTNPDPARGMFSSIQAGLGAVAGAVVLVLPGDMPFVPPDVVAAIAENCARTDEVVVPVHEGRRGHPIGIPGRFRSGLVAAPVESTLKEALLAVSGWVPREFRVNAPGVLRDVDVPGDLGAGS